MKFSKLLSKLGLKRKPKQVQQKETVNEQSKEPVKKQNLENQNIVNKSNLPKPKVKSSKYPQSTFELIKKYGNELEAQEVIVKRLTELDEVARGYALDSLMDHFEGDPKVIKLLDKYLNGLLEEEKIWTLRDFAFHHGDMESIRVLIGKHITTLSPENKYFLLTDLTVHHGADNDVQKLIVKYIDDLCNQHKYDILYCLSHLHGLNQNVQNLILSNLKDLSDSQIKEIFSGLIPNVAKNLIGKHIDSLSEKNRSILVKNASKDKKEELKEKPDKIDKFAKTNKLEKVEIMLLDLSNVKKTKNHLGEDSFKVNFNNPVKIYPYVNEKNDDTQIGDAFLTVRDNKIYATVTLCPQLRETTKKLNSKKFIYKPSGNLAIFKGEAQQMSVDFIYLVF